MTFASIKQPLSLVAHGDAYAQLTQTQLNHDTSINAFEQGKAACASGDYNQAIDSYTKAIQSLKADLSVVLLHRAGAYEMNRLYELSLKDAERANPAQDVTYDDALDTQVNALIFQNSLIKAAKQLGKAINAIPEQEPRHAKLVEKRKDVMDEIMRQNGWLTRALPYEVLGRILSYLSSKDYITLSMTCRFWRNYMLYERPEMYHTIHSEHLPHSYPLVKQFLQSVIPDKVKKVVLDFNQSRLIPGDWIGDASINTSELVLRTIKERNWSKIEHLEINNLDRTSLCALRRLDQGITDGFQWRRGSVIANDEQLVITEICPNLASLANNSTANYGTLCHIDTSLPPTPLCLTELEVSCRMESASLLEVLKNAPYLASLTLYSHVFPDNGEILGFVYHHCPALESLTYISQTHQRDTKRRLLPTYTIPSRPCSGLKSMELSFNTETTNDTHRYLGLILKRGRKTLMSLSLRSIWARTDDDCLSILANTGAPQLQTLIIDARCQPSNLNSFQLKKILENCPSLVTVTLEGSHLWHDRTLRALGKLTYMRELTMTLLSIRFIPKPGDGAKDGTYSVDGLAALLGNASNLRRFSFHHENKYYSDEVNNTSFSTIARLVCNHPHIRELHMDDNNISNEQFSSFVDLLRDSQITKLKIDIPYSDYSAFVKLATLSNVEYMFINDVNFDVSQDEFKEFLSSHQGSKPLYVIELGNSDGVHYQGCKQIASEVDANGTWKTKISARKVFDYNDNDEPSNCPHCDQPYAEDWEPPSHWYEVW